LTSLVPISGIPRRPRGHRLTGSRADRKLPARSSRDEHTGLDPRDRDRHRAAPFGDDGIAIGMPSIVSRGDRIAPAARVVGRRMVVRLLTSPRTVLTSEPPRRAPARHAGCSSASAVRPGLPSGAPGRPDARCVGPTSALSLLRTRTRASSTPGGVTPRFRGKRTAEQWPDARQRHWLRWVARASVLAVGLRRGGRSLPTAACASGPLTPLSPLPSTPGSLARSRIVTGAAEIALDRLA